MFQNQQEQQHTVSIFNSHAEQQNPIRTHPPIVGPGPHCYDNVVRQHLHQNDKNLNYPQVEQQQQLQQNGLNQVDEIHNHVNENPITGTTKLYNKTYNFPTVIGPYRIIQQIGMGGFGSVYEVEGLPAQEVSEVERKDSDHAGNPPMIVQSNSRLSLDTVENNNVNDLNNVADNNENAAEDYCGGLQRNNGAVPVGRSGRAIDYLNPPNSGRSVPVVAGKRYALKLLACRNEGHRKTIENEVQILQIFSNPNRLSIYSGNPNVNGDKCVTSSSTVLTTSSTPSGTTNLSSEVNSPDKFNNKTCLNNNNNSANNRVIKIYGTWHNPYDDKYELLLELAPHGSLQRYMFQQKDMIMLQNALAAKFKLNNNVLKDLNKSESSDVTINKNKENACRSDEADEDVRRPLINGPGVNDVDVMNEVQDYCYNNSRASVSTVTLVDGSSGINEINHSSSNGGAFSLPDSIPTHTPPDNVTTQRTLLDHNHDIIKEWLSQSDNSGSKFGTRNKFNSGNSGIISNSSNLNRISNGSDYEATLYLKWPKQLLHMMQEMSQCVCDVHKEGVLHADVKLENFLVVSSGDGDSTKEHVKITDFGLSSRIPNYKGIKSAVKQELALKKEGTITQTSDIMDIDNDITTVTDNYDNNMTRGLKRRRLLENNSNYSYVNGVAMPTSNSLSAGNSNYESANSQDSECIDVIEMLVPCSIGTVHYMAPDVMNKNKAQMSNFGGQGSKNISIRKKPQVDLLDQQVQQPLIEGVPVVNPMNLNESFVTRKTDVWSLGMCDYYLIFWHFPKKHCGRNVAEITSKIQDFSKEIDFPSAESVLKRMHPGFGSNGGTSSQNINSSESSESYTQSELDLIQFFNTLIFVTQGCLEYHPLLRFTAQEVVSMLKRVERYYLDPEFGLLSSGGPSSTTSNSCLNSDSTPKKFPRFFTKPLKTHLLGCLDPLRTHLAEKRWNEIHKTNTTNLVATQPEPNPPTTLFRQITEVVSDCFFPPEQPLVVDPRRFSKESSMMDSSDHTHTQESDETCLESRRSSLNSVTYYYPKRVVREEDLFNLFEEAPMDTRKQSISYLGYNYENQFYGSTSRLSLSLSSAISSHSQTHSEAQQQQLCVAATVTGGLNQTTLIPDEGSNLWKKLNGHLGIEDDSELNEGALAALDQDISLVNDSESDSKGSTGSTIGTLLSNFLTAPACLLFLGLTVVVSGIVIGFGLNLIRQDRMQIEELKNRLAQQQQLQAAAKLSPPRPPVTTPHNVIVPSVMAPTPTVTTLSNNNNKWQYATSRSTTTTQNTGLSNTGTNFLSKRPDVLTVLTNNNILNTRTPESTESPVTTTITTPSPTSKRIADADIDILSLVDIIVDIYNNEENDQTQSNVKLVELNEQLNKKVEGLQIVGPTNRRLNPESIQVVNNVVPNYQKNKKSDSESPVYSDDNDGLTPKTYCGSSGASSISSSSIITETSNPSKGTSLIGGGGLAQNISRPRSRTMSQESSSLRSYHHPDNSPVFGTNSINKDTGGFNLSLGLNLKLKGLSSDIGPGGSAGPDVNGPGLYLPLRSPGDKEAIEARTKPNVSKSTFSHARSGSAGCVSEVMGGGASATNSVSEGDESMICNGHITPDGDVMRINPKELRERLHDINNNAQDDMVANEDYVPIYPSANDVKKMKPGKSGSCSSSATATPQSSCRHSFKSCSVGCTTPCSMTPLCTPPTGPQEPPPLQLPELADDPLLLEAQNDDRLLIKPRHRSTEFARARAPDSDSDSSGPEDMSHEEDLKTSRSTSEKSENNNHSGGEIRRNSSVPPTLHSPAPERENLSDSGSSDHPDYPGNSPSPYYEGQPLFQSVPWSPKSPSVHTIGSQYTFGPGERSPFGPSPHCCNSGLGFGGCPSSPNGDVSDRCMMGCYSDPDNVELGPEGSSTSESAANIDALQSSQTSTYISSSGPQKPHCLFGLPSPPAGVMRPRDQVVHCTTTLDVTGREAGVTTGEPGSFSTVSGRTGSKSESSDGGSSTAADIQNEHSINYEQAAANLPFPPRDPRQLQA